MPEVPLPGVCLVCVSAWCEERAEARPSGVALLDVPRGRTERLLLPGSTDRMALLRREGDCHAELSEKRMQGLPPSRYPGRALFPVKVDRPWMGVLGPVVRCEGQWASEGMEGVSRGGPVDLGTGSWAAGAMAGPLVEGFCAGAREATSQ